MWPEETLFWGTVDNQGECHQDPRADEGQGTQGYFPQLSAGDSKHFRRHSLKHCAYNHYILRTTLQVTHTQVQTKQATSPKLTPSVRGGAPFQVLVDWFGAHALHCRLNCASKRRNMSVDNIGTPGCHIVPVLCSCQCPLGKFHENVFLPKRRKTTHPHHHDQVN